MRRLWLRPGRLVGTRSMTEGVGGGGGGREGGEVSESWQNFPRQEASRKFTVAAGEGSGKEERKIHGGGGNAWNLKSPRMGVGGGEEGGGWMAALDSRRRVFPTNTSTDSTSSTPPPSPVPLPLPSKSFPSSKPSSAPSTPSSASLSFASLSISIDSDKEDDYEDDDCYYSDSDDDDIYTNNDVPLLSFLNLSPLSLLARHNPFPISNRSHEHSKNSRNSRNSKQVFRDFSSGIKENDTLSTLISPRYDIRHHHPSLFSPNRRTNRKSRSTPCSPRTGLDPKISLPSPCVEFDFKFPSCTTNNNDKLETVNASNANNNNNLNNIDKSSFNISRLCPLDLSSTLISPLSNYSDVPKSPLFSIRSDLDSISTLISPRRTGLRSTLYSLSNLEAQSTLLSLPLPPPFSNFAKSPRSAPPSPSTPDSKRDFDPNSSQISPWKSQSTVFLTHSTDRGDCGQGSGQLSADVAGSNPGVAARKRQWGAPSGVQSLGAKWRPRLAVIGEGELAEGGREGGRARLRLMEAKRKGGEKTED